MGACKHSQCDKWGKTNRCSTWKIKFKHSYITSVLNVERSQSLLSSASALSPQPSYRLSKQKTLVCFPTWTAHIPVKRHIEPCKASEHSKEERLNSSTNAYLFPILAPFHNTLLLLSQHEAVISLAPECMCMPTVEIFFGEKQYVVLCRGFLSF